MTQLPRLEHDALRAVVHAAADWAAACQVFGRGADMELLGRVLRGDGFHAEVAAAATAAYQAGRFVPVSSRVGIARAGWLGPHLIEPVAAAVREYLDVLAREGRGVPPSPVDVQKSALLCRLLSGKHALPEAPPVSYSYPWYEVVEEAGPHRCEVGGAVTLGTLIGMVPDGVDRVVVNQSLWDVVDAASDCDMSVRWRGRGAVYRLWTAEGVSSGSAAWLIQKTAAS